MEKGIDRVVEILDRSRNTVVVTGAGISTEAGIPDFRGSEGIYRKLGENRVMNIINIDFFRNNPLEFYKFYREYFIFPPVEPGKAHHMLAEMEREGIIKTIVTQNIDNLHQIAGSKKVIPIHGNGARFLCLERNCRSVHDSSYVNKYPEIIPRCSQCGGILKPDVVLFGEHIKNYTDAMDRILGARVLLVIGSSLTVYPLAGFVKEFSTFTQYLIIINKGPTPLDHVAVVKLHDGNTGELLEEILEKIKKRRKQQL
ncbi:MAG: Sir2 family NAD-dependent protein deacetylase [Syntrophomonas sp.]|uniref:SIR2 family NAD-dependent protein deacylase n=1 Tax=Syntrophomonas sp. TaxID=2053627 RepID=UPI0026287550|nr:Sir2 family NAD-dependent protein deacetylase [Syntrophomonas sp.]MDD2509964.1 Sir2 family NAD-dependent protein deacetylase [Syntrophomonas sp.]MDD3878765.1 Sir2 family NAD-dependent protein deacetylase [Syntrophomonas sp.]MDD4626665.1 Sir2 family NAD-dependent protein deacetylase [Syntrophomonas sp.]